MRRAAMSVLALSVVLVSITGCQRLDGDGATGATGLVDTTGVFGIQREQLDLSGLGDEYLPQAGNGGYDVRHYDIFLECDPRTDVLSGVTIVEAQALVSLDEFHLDLVGLEVEDVQLDGEGADHRREGQELIVECPETLGEGADFAVAVAYSGSPQPMTSAEGYALGWQHSGETIFTMDEPEGAATWYPVNDHPSDKATYSFRLTVPTPYVAVANGVLIDTEERGTDRTFVWEMEQPMANYLASVVVGELVREDGASSGGIPIRDYFAPDIARQAEGIFSNTGEVLDYFSELFGPYPFDVYGAVVPDASTSGAAMENQTLSLFGRDTLEEYMAHYLDAQMYISHELAHAWFGNSVTPAEWRDIWLNEGFATYASWLWFEHEFGSDGMEASVQYAFRILSSADKAVPGDPGLDKLFSGPVYQRGALTLHALRLTIGDDMFFTILRDWVAEHAYGNVTTGQFVNLVDAATRDLEGFDSQAFFDAWLYDEEMPELPTADATG